MHPTALDLNLFGQPALAPPRSVAVVRHLRRGCASCQARLAPRLIPWMDDEPAAEARAVEPDRWSRSLRLESMRAVARAARSATRALARPPGERLVRRALGLLDAEGPAVIGRLPRHLLGAPAIEAVLRHVMRAGLIDPRLRLRLAELAHDLVEQHRTDGAYDRDRLQGFDCRARIELANAHRVLGDHRAAQDQLNVVAEILHRGGQRPWIEARWLEIQACLLTDQHRLGAGGAFNVAARQIYRRCACPSDVARTLVTHSNTLGLARSAEQAHALCIDSLNLLAGHDEPELVASTLHSSCYTLMRAGRPREGLAAFIDHRDRIMDHTLGRNRARAHRLEAHLFDAAGDAASADRAFTAACRGLDALGRSYEYGIALLYQAAARRGGGDPDGARPLVLQATEAILRSRPHREAYTTIMVLRAADRFSATRDTLPLDRVAAFLDAAEFNPSLRLETFLVSPDPF